MLAELAILTILAILHEQLQQRPGARRSGVIKEGDVDPLLPSAEATSHPTRVHPVGIMSLGAVDGS